MLVFLRGIIDMVKLEYKATLQMLVPMIIQIIIEKKDLQVIPSVKLLYASKLYEKLVLHEG